MHWQQYLTAITACFVAAVFIGKAVLAFKQNDRIAGVIQIGITAFGQWVLYSGGWYGQ